MSLLDPFHPPLSERRPWESFHATWCSALADHLNQTILPKEYIALEQVHAGPGVEIDVATFAEQGTPGNNGGTATLPKSVWLPQTPPVDNAGDGFGHEVGQIKKTETFLSPSGSRSWLVSNRFSGDLRSRLAFSQFVLNSSSKYSYRSPSAIGVSAVRINRLILGVGFPAASGAQRSPNAVRTLAGKVGCRRRLCAGVNIVPDEPDGSVGEQDVHPTGVAARSSKEAAIGIVGGV